MLKFIVMKRTFLYFGILLLIPACNRLSSIPYIPEQTPESWLTFQPFKLIKFGALEFILVQPSSTVFVYLLGLVGISLGIYFYRIQGNQKSRFWWGTAMLLWGIGALLAGTSYQAFSYEIKCAGNEICSWTSWWEVIYLVLSAASVDALIVAEAYACCIGKWRKTMIVYAAINFGLYTIAILLGVLLLDRFLLSFELLLVATAPSILMFLILDTWRYFKFRTKQDLVLLFTWLWLGITFGGYFMYMVLGIGERLWENGIWFSANDVLHLGLIMWMLYIAYFVANQVTDSLMEGT
jgi:hypothetical protein